MLDPKEIQFIRSMAIDFIASYSSHGEIKLEGECDPDEILYEIQICQSLIDKLKN